MTAPFTKNMTATLILQTTSKYFLDVLVLLASGFASPQEGNVSFLASPAHYES